MSLSSDDAGIDMISGTLLSPGEDVGCPGRPLAFIFTKTSRISLGEELSLFCFLCEYVCIYI